MVAFDLSKFFVGVDISGNSIKVSIVDADGVEIYSWHRLRDEGLTSRGPSAVCDSILTSISGSLGEVLDGICRREPENNLSIDSLRSLISGFGVCLPGAIYRSDSFPAGIPGGDMLFDAPNLPWPKNFAFRDCFSKIAAVHFKQFSGKGPNQFTVLCNDSEPFALAHVRARYPEGFSHKILVACIGTGLGGAVVQNGRVECNRFGISSELGHTRVDPNGIFERRWIPTDVENGDRRRLENYSCLVALNWLLLAILKEGNLDHPLNNIYRSDPREAILSVRGFAIDGDKLSRQILGLQARMLGRAFASFAMTASVSEFVVGGGIFPTIPSDADRGQVKAVQAYVDFYLSEVRDQFLMDCKLPFAEQMPIERALVPEEVAAFGMAGLAAQTFSS